MPVHGAPLSVAGTTFRRARHLPGFGRRKPLRRGRSGSGRSQGVGATTSASSVSAGVRTSSAPRHRRNAVTTAPGALAVALRRELRGRLGGRQALQRGAQSGARRVVVLPLGRTAASAPRTSAVGHRRPAGQRDLASAGVSDSTRSSVSSSTRTARFSRATPVTCCCRTVSTWRSAGRSRDGLLGLLPAAAQRLPHGCHGAQPLGPLLRSGGSSGARPSARSSSWSASVVARRCTASCDCASGSDGRTVFTATATQPPSRVSTV